ncbi:hypothetical protein EGY04_07520 [Enterobacter roggenkampii]|uniref:hypothetical protein n=1 Tax=Enterobacter cloacae complex TaxID=354276 RepID=UPI000791247D|nr:MULTISPECIES: hypothetical protein [Enterobacter cloacae complex]AYY04888.1 hypothetical protein EGY04_07520 [Enterobacter roggenkampii]QLU98359.1 hypothetical protein HV268_18905 [Enterobacter roggenkampii]QMR80552.1 hypothetical protein HV097_07105 [Enterobacter roggenkampii]CZX30193.1 Uncharacterised protein [Enterobacter kobei]HDR2854927.1 hypothetical protein [Enterobacter roggenkampii]
MKTSPQLETSPVKELVRAGHELAAAMGADTPLIEIAKLVSRLATALDVQLTRANALDKPMPYGGGSAIAIKQPKRLYEWHGATVALKRETANGWAKLPAGTEGTIRTVKGSRRGLEFVSNPCRCCGVQVSIKGMRPEHFELLELMKGNAGEEK